MQLRELQNKVQASVASNSNPWNNPSEIMLAVTEEVGEVAQEVALLEKIGSKAAWTKTGDKERLAKEITQVLNCLCALASHYEIDIEQAYKE